MHSWEKEHFCTLADTFIVREYLSLCGGIHADNELAHAVTFVGNSGMPMQKAAESGHSKSMR